MSKSLQHDKVNGEKITYWRSIDNRRRTEDYLASIENEFVSDLTDITAMDRRSMLKVMGASIALSGIGVSCRRPEEKILPYVKQPDGITPGIPNFFATAQPSPFGASGILVESHEGRPTKVEGNPTHPESLGKASTINQAAALEIYDPDRSRFCVKETAGDRLPVDWADFDSFFAEHFFELKKTGGAGLAIVSNNDLSPTFLRLKGLVKTTYPQAKFYTHEPLRQRNIEKASAMAFGAHTRVRYNLENARVMASLFCDPFSVGPEHVRHIRGYAKNRSVYNAKDAKGMNRLYAVEADYTLAGTNADHRLRLPMGQAVSFIKALAYELHATHGLDLDKGLRGGQSLTALVSRPPSYKGIDKKFIIVMAKDLAQNKGASLILGGDMLPPSALALIHVLNMALLGEKRTFEVLAIDDQDAKTHLDAPGIDELAQDLSANRVSTLVMLGVNPAYDAPRHLKVKDLISKAKTSIHMGQSLDETAALCTWHVPETHFLEHFSDTRSYDGHITIIQPLIKPLHNARSTVQVLAQMLGLDWKNALSLVKDTHKARFGQADFDKQFNRAIHDGLITGSAFKPITVTSLDSAPIYKEFEALKPQMPTKDSLELVLPFDRRVLDGRYANHGWLQELADPVTKLNWGNALLMSPQAAKEYGIKSGVKKNAYVADMVKLTVNNQSLNVPVFVMPGLSDYSVVITLGYGRSNAGVVGNGVGFDVYGLMPHYHDRVVSGVKLERTLETYKVSSTQEQFAMNGDVIQATDTLSLQTRDPARVTNVADYIKTPLKAKQSGIPQNLLVNEPGKAEKVPLQITDAWDYSKGNQWGMVIDLAKCTGCNACVVACQSENNIPIVGKEQVIRGRMMHWLRVDRYFVGDVKSPLAISQPVPCQHCENAPCEPVCPVAATSHDKEGLNVMTYNRCVGTRYCANNCPFKVRRFNYFDFTDSGNMYVEPEKVARQKTLKLQRNPDVTVRYRGVMEKCTFCTQRIQEAKMSARRAGSDQNNLPDGAVVPACAQTCPSEAIVFGNINDETSAVSTLKKVDRNYTMLDVLNARPRTSYLSMLRNPHPDLVA
jgi:Fe-S-cluster-containing dehydrogenase component